MVYTIKGNNNDILLLYMDMEKHITFNCKNSHINFILSRYTFCLFECLQWVIIAINYR